MVFTKKRGDFLMGDIGKIRIYTITSTEGYYDDRVGSHLSLLPWGGNSDGYKGFDDGGVMYKLPDHLVDYTITPTGMGVYCGGDLYELMADNCSGLSFVKVLEIHEIYKIDTDQ